MYTAWILYTTNRLDARRYKEFFSFVTKRVIGVKIDLGRVSGLDTRPPCVSFIIFIPERSPLYEKHFLYYEF